MNRERKVLLALALVVVAGAVPTLVGARPANQIPVQEVDANATTMLKPGAEEWTETPSVDVPLTSAASGVPNTSKVSVETVKVRAVRTDGRIFVRMQWADATADDHERTLRSFADAAALQMPVNTSTRPAIAMGSTRKMVNVWYWSADNTSEELLAGGAGSTTRFGNASIATNASHENGTWTVVYGRERTANATNRTSIDGERDLDVAFAVWNGSNGERSGRKAVSEWYTFPLGPGPQGPPYETALWLVSGVAMAVVVVVTVYGVRSN